MWPFKKKPNIAKSFGVNVSRTLPVAPPNTAPKPLGCVAKKIIEDLKIEGWFIKYGKYSSTSRVISHTAFAYHLIYDQGIYSNCVGTVNISELNHNPLTHEEQDAISMEIEQLINRKNQAQQQKLVAADNERLKRLFPDCFN